MPSIDSIPITGKQPLEQNKTIFADIPNKQPAAKDEIIAKWMRPPNNKESDAIELLANKSVYENLSFFLNISFKEKRT